MIPIHEYIRHFGFLAPTFTLVCDDGTNINLAAEFLRRDLLPHHDLAHSIPTDVRLFWRFLEVEKNISPARIIELSRKKHLDPIIFCEIEDHHFLCDGHHRYALACVRGQSTISGFIVPEDVWRNYELSGIPDLTQPELADIPIYNRNY